MDDLKEISFVIPCYNSENTIEDVIKEIETTMKSHKEDSYEIVLVNDCSKDNVWKTIEKLCNSNKKIKAINFAKNFGQHAALIAGYRETNGKIVVSLDDDQQTPVEEVYSLIDKINENCDVVYASYKHKKHNIFRNIGTVFNNLMCEIMLNKRKDIMITSFFAAKKFVIDEIVKYKNSYTYVPGLVLRTTSHIENVPVNHRARAKGSSGYTFSKLLGLWINGFTAFSVIPLRISTIIGVISTIIGFIYGLCIVINKLFLNTITVQGYASIVALILFVGGIIMMMLGMIGEYIGRIYICLNDSPQYVIKDKINTDK